MAPRQKTSDKKQPKNYTIVFVDHKAFDTENNEWGNYKGNNGSQAATKAAKIIFKKIWEFENNKEKYSIEKVKLPIKKLKSKDIPSNAFKIKFGLRCKSSNKSSKPNISNWVAMVCLQENPVMYDENGEPKMFEKEVDGKKVMVEQRANKFQSWDYALFSYVRRDMKSVVD